MAAVIGIFMEFPIEVMERVADPVHGLPSRVRRPYLTDIRKACEEAYEPIARRLERERAVTDPGRLLGPPPAAPKLTVDELEAKLGRPLPKLRRIDGAVRMKSIEEAQAAAAARRAPPQDEPPEAA